MQQLNKLLAGAFLLLMTGGLNARDTIESILVSGNRRVAKDSILFRLSSKEGQPLQPHLVTLDIKTLWDTGLFQNLGAQVEDGEKGKILTYIVRELPIVAEVDIRGNRKLGKSTITDKIDEELLTIPTDAPLDFRKVTAVRALIKKLLDERGMRNGKVEYDLEYLDAGTARVVFNITEGSKVRIYTIDFKGNEVFSDRKLRRTMRKVKEHWMFSWLTQHDVYNEEKFSEDVDKLKEKYWKLGYKDIFVGEPSYSIEDLTTEKQKIKNEKRIAKLQNPKEDLRMTLTIPVYEGKPYKMGGFSVEGNSVLNAKYYETFFPLKKGDVYDLSKINEWIDNLEKMHNNWGYINYAIQQDVSINNETSVDLKFVVRENDQFYVHRIKFSGNVTTRDKVLRREVLLREGDVFRLQSFRNSLLRINQLGFFDVSKSEPDIRPIPNENRLNVGINGQESGVNELNFGVGFSEFQGTSGFLSFSTLNFLGRGQKLKVQATLGSFADTYDLSFTEPWLFDKPRGFTARFFNTRSNSEASGFIQEQSGLQFGLSFRPSTFSTYSISYSFSEINIPSVSTAEFQPINDLLTSTVSQSIRYDRTDHPFFPKTGYKASLIFDLSGWQAGGDSYFYKVTLQGSQFLPAFKKTFIGLNLKMATLETLEDQRPLRHELFFLGGEESVRGYDTQSLGPTTVSNGRVLALRGDKLFQANFEYIIPVSDQFRFVVFYDTGMIYGLDEDWFDTTLAASTGVEMRFSLPVFQAPLRLIYAYRLEDNPLNEKGGDPKFSIGTTF